MKKRRGFVANSSSSSFIVAVKGKLTKNKVLKALGVSKKSPLFSVADEWANIMSSDGLDKFATPQQMADKYYGFGDVSSVEPRFKKLFDRGMVVYHGRACDDSGNYAEYVLRGARFNVESDDICIYVGRD